MRRIIDLSLPIVEHFRWPVERKLVGDMAKGDNFQITWLGMPSTPSPTSTRPDT